MPLIVSGTVAGAITIIWTRHAMTLQDALTRYEALLREIAARIAREMPDHRALGSSHEGQSCRLGSEFAAARIRKRTNYRCHGEEAEWFASLPRSNRRTIQSAGLHSSAVMSGRPEARQGGKPCIVCVAITGSLPTKAPTTRRCRSPSPSSREHAGRLRRRCGHRPRPCAGRRRQAELGSGEVRPSRSTARE